MKQKILFLSCVLLFCCSISAETYVIKIIQEGEDTQNVSEYTETKCNLTTISIDDERVSNGKCVRIAPKTTNGKWDVTYNIEGILPGIYNVHVVTLPKTMVNETATDLPVKYKVSLKSGNQEGQETEADCGAFASTATEITDNVVENVEITGNYAKITIKANATPKRPKAETSEMYLDCIYLEREINIPEVTFPNIAVNETNFPDEKFRNWVFMQSYGIDGVLTPDEISTVTSINISGKKIQNLKGIEYFTTLDELDCSNNQLTSLDVSKNTVLTKLRCYQNRINGAGMDSFVENLPTVSSGGIYVIYEENGGNRMTNTQVSTAKAKGWTPYYSYNNDWKEYKGYDPSSSLEINETNFPDENFRSCLLEQDYGRDEFLTDEEILNIKQIGIYGQQIQNLKGIEYFTVLERLYCSNNQLTSLDVSKNSMLRELSCSANQLGTLDVSKNAMLKELECSNNPLTSVTLGNGITSIRLYAFYGCSGLTSIDIPNSVTSIEYRAFSGCSGLTSVTIPGSVTSIGDDAFYGCSGLTSVTIPSSVTSIGDEAFYNCTNLTSVTIPNSVTSMGRSAFSGCSSLTEVTIGTGLTRITGFSGCTSLKSVTIPNSVTSIGNSAFYGCSGLTSIIIPNSVTEIESNAFSDCTGLTSVTFGNNVAIIGSSAFSGCTSLTSITIPNSVIIIGSGGFKDCTGLTSITIGNNVTTIGSSVFSGCSSLTSITIPNSVTSIGSGAFYNCSGLTSITIPNSVTSIEGGAFAECSSLTEVTIGTGLTKITGFNGCASLKSVIIPNTVTEISAGAFSDCTGLTSVTIGNNVTTIGSGAFQGCSGLTSITIPNSVATIESGAFSGCSDLIDVTIGNSVTTIENGTFKDCSSLTSISIGRGVIAISSAFSDCSNLKDVYCYAEDVPVATYAFKDINIANATLYVPKVLIDTYKVTDPWSGFGNIIELEEFDPTPIIKYVRGDANGDGEIGMSDVMFIINYIHGTPANTFKINTADANLDGKIDMQDVTLIVQKILTDQYPDGDISDDSNVDDLYEDKEYSSMCLPAIMEEDPTISIFCQALKLTNMAGYMKKYIDYTYSVNPDSVTYGVYKRFGGKDMWAHYNEKRYFKYTAFVETNEVLKKYGINSLEDLIARAKSVYDATFPNDAGLYDNDYTNRKNPLNRWVSYHLMNRYGNYSDWAPSGTILEECCLTEVADAEDFWQTMLNEGMIRFCRASGQLYANRKGLKNEVLQGLKGVRVLTDSESGSGNMQAINGRYFYLDDIMEYNTDVRDKVLNCRMRIDATTLSADFMNQGSRGNYGWDENYLFAHKRGYIEGWNISPETFVGVHCDNPWWSSYLGNAVAVKGQFDVQIKLPNPPPGLYEIRMAYVASDERGVVQVYVNNEPCGNPVDLRKSVWNYVELDRDRIENDEDYNDALDKDLRKLGYMLGPDSYSKPGLTDFRVGAPEHLRKILTTAQFSEGKDNWLRIRQIMDGDVEWSFDYIELCPVDIVNGEDRH